jgi:hypothetical protein
MSFHPSSSSTGFLESAMPAFLRASCPRQASQTRSK